MTKQELIELFNKLDIPFNEGISSDKNTNIYPRIVFWDYIWEDNMASGDNYDSIETYQVSFYSKTPRNQKLIELRNLLRDVDVHPVIYHEFVDNDKVFHSYFNMELIVDE